MKKYHFWTQHIHSSLLHTQPQHAISPALGCLSAIRRSQWAEGGIAAMANEENVGKSMLFKNIAKLCFIAAGDERQARCCDNDLFVLRHQNEAENTTDGNRPVLSVKEIVALYLKDAKRRYDELMGEHPSSVLDECVVRLTMCFDVTMHANLKKDEQNKLFKFIWQKTFDIVEYLLLSIFFIFYILIVLVIILKKYRHISYE